jgi:hypothetical protein
VVQAAELQVSAGEPIVITAPDQWTSAKEKSQAALLPSALPFLKLMAVHPSAKEGNRADVELKEFYLRNCDNTIKPFRFGRDDFIGGAECGTLSGCFGFQEVPVGRRRATTPRLLYFTLDQGEEFAWSP